MWRSATSSERVLTVAILLLVTIALPETARAKVFLSVDEALELAFAGCRIERQTVYLTAAQLERARELAGMEMPGAIIHPYVARSDSGLAGTAYFDTHRVRTLPQTVMVVVGTDDRVRRIEILDFSEPESYLVRDRWYEQFMDRGLDADLALERGIHGVTGATLTARATTAAVRRTLALHQVIGEARAR